MQAARSVLVLRRLLARIRDVMAGEGDGQARLARIVQVIALDMAAQVCSIYVRRAGDVLELFATQGLKPTAIHRTKLRIGEGLIGEIAARARPLALAEAQGHPSFVYRPETGEEIFHSLMGVPILRGGRVVGVLAIQNIDRRQYTDEEIEALQTIAMVLAELVGSGNLVGANELAQAEGSAIQPLRLEGARLSPGLGLGIAILHKHRHLISRVVAEDVPGEQARLATAVASMHGAIDKMLKANSIEGDHRDVLETYRMIAADDGWLRRIRDAIDTGLTAEAAVHKVNAEIHARLGAVADPYLRERVHDLEDLAHRLMQHLTGGDDTAIDLPTDQDFVLVARHLGPAQLLDYHRPSLKGVVLAEGSTQAHVAIIARALGVPVIGQVQDLLTQIEDGDLVIVDADHAQLLVRPGDDVVHIYRRSLSDRQRRLARYAQLADLPAVTRDGTKISLQINAGLLLDLQSLTDLGIDGVGLYRTEVPFMVRTALPDVEAQRQLYRQVFDRAHGKPVVFRTLDVGGDKLLPYWRKAEEDNPAMGWRAIRVSRDRPALLRQQLRALLRAADGEELWVMFPMIAEVEEFRFARRLLETECERLRAAGVTMPSNLKVGAMLEVPALLFQLDALVSTVDFLSIGTNDLFQFLFASDRSSFRMSEHYDVLSPVFLELLHGLIARCDRAGIPLSLCGEMAGRPLDAMALLGLGLRSISVAPPSVGPIKAMIRSLDLGALTAFAAALCNRNQGSVREDLRAFAHDHRVVI